MRLSRRTLTGLLPLLLLGLLAVQACSVSLRQRAVQQVQTIDTILATAQDAEINLYASGAVPALTPEKHRAYHAALAKGFDAAERVAIATKAWRAGDPVPNDTRAILDAAEEALGVLEGVLPEQHRLFGLVRQWLETAIALEQMFAGGGA
jgi:hypothetical protein